MAPQDGNWLSTVLASPLDLAAVLLIAYPLLMIMLVGVRRPAPRLLPPIIARLVGILQVALGAILVSRPGGPTWLLVGGSSIAIAGFAWWYSGLEDVDRFRMRRRRSRPGRCPRCGYRLIVPSTRCPECGLEPDRLVRPPWAEPAPP